MKRTAPLRFSRPLLAAAALAIAVAPSGARAQSITMVGSLANFDVLNNTGEVAHGFEIELDGVYSVDLFRIFGSWSGQNVIRYGAGTAYDFPGGTVVRWAAAWDAGNQQWTDGTPVPVNRTTVPGESCWTLGMGQAYYSAGCEHFGISAYKNATQVTYRWLIADPNNPGQLIVANTLVALPPPVWTVVPPQQLGAAPVVIAEVQAPPPVVQVQFGDAQWVKVYKTEQNGEAQLEDLVGENHAVVPQDPGQIEVSWSLLQADPPAGGHQKRKGKLANQGNLGNGSHAVVRRYEYYQYAGTYDPITHEALCADGTCTAPSPGELGDAIGAQNAAANVNAPQLSVSKVGNGNVSSADKVLSCGNKCSAFYAMGTQVTLTASPGSGAVFGGWSGSCHGDALSCTVSVDDAITASASFLTLYTLSIARSGNGTVTGTPSGNDRALNCGGTCSAKFVQGTTVTLTATPAPGAQFTGWTGACVSNVPTCTMQVNSNATAQANFR